MTTTPPKIDWNSLLDVQQEIHRWASESFPQRTAFQALSKLVLHEIPELLTHEKEHGLATIGTELADCFILLMDLASIWKVDLDDAIYLKMQINYKRQWTIGEGGLMQHIPTVDDSYPPLVFGALAGAPACSHCKSSSHTRPIEGSDPTFPGDKIAELPFHNYFCTACNRGFEA